MYIQIVLLYFVQIEWLNASYDERNQFVPA